MSGYAFKSFFIALSFLSLTTDVLADCATRHFYNNSNYVFIINLQRGTCSTNGPNEKSCYIAPHSVAEIHYPNDTALNIIGVLSGSMYKLETITVSSVQRRVYQPTSFYVNECYIGHSGRTGNISVNDPADGDIQTCGNRC